MRTEDLISANVYIVALAGIRPRLMLGETQRYVGMPFLLMKVFSATGLASTCQTDRPLKPLTGELSSVDFTCYSGLYQGLYIRQRLISSLS